MVNGVQWVAGNETPSHQGFVLTLSNSAYENHGSSSTSKEEQPVLKKLM